MESARVSLKQKTFSRKKYSIKKALEFVGSSYSKHLTLIFNVNEIKITYL